MIGDMFFFFQLIQLKFKLFATTRLGVAIFMIIIYFYWFPVQFFEIEIN